jgi:hypothetical protein
VMKRAVCSAERAKRFLRVLTWLCSWTEALLFWYCE